MSSILTALIIVAAVEEVYNEIAKLVDDRNWKEARDAAVKAKYLEGIEDAAKDRWHALSQ